MLPTFPKSQKILSDEWNQRMFAKKNDTFPLELHPPILQIVEGKDSDFERDDGKIKSFNIKLHSVSVRHQIENDRGMTLEEFRKKADEAGEGLGKDMWQSITETITQAVAETGNEVKVKKGNLTQDDMLKMLETRAHNFDEFGMPQGRLVCGSEFANEVKQRIEEWKDDKGFHAKAEEIIRRKKAEFNEREARRRLVG